MDPVRLEVTFSVDDALIDAARRVLEQELAGIARDLGLPIEPVIERRAMGAGAAAGRGAVDLAIDGRPVEILPPWVAWQTETPPQQLASLVHANASALVTPAVVERLWQGWGGKEGPPEGFGALLRKLVAHRVRADRIAAAVPVWSASDADPFFEHALNATDRRVYMELHPDTHRRVGPELAKGDMLQMMADGLFYELGINTGECQPREAADLEPDRVRFRINDLRSESHPLIGTGQALVNDTVDRLRLLNIRGREAYNPANGSECAVIPEQDVPVCEQAGLTTWNQGGYLILLTSAVLRRSAAALLSSDYVAFVLDRLAEAFPLVVQSAEKDLGVPMLTAVLRALLREEIGIRNLAVILESILTMPPHANFETEKYIIFPSTWNGIRPRLQLGSPEDTGVSETVEYVRMSLKQYISHKYTRGSNTLIVYLIDPKIEERLRDPRPLDEKETRELLDAVQAEVGNLPPTAQNPVLLTTATIRYRLRQQIHGAFPYLAVLDYQELSPDMNIQPIARISLD